MDIVFFIIFVSLLVVAILVLFAFFPIRVSWFYYRSKTLPRHRLPTLGDDTPSREGDFDASLRYGTRAAERAGGATPRRGNPKQIPTYKQLGDDSYDDPEL